MASKNPKKGTYHPKNPAKYVGNKFPTYRSTWEYMFMKMCDNHPNVIEWSSEPIELPYRNPATGKQTVYVPDFLIVYKDKNGQKHTEVVEIKPSKESSIKYAASNKDRMNIAVNQEKWKAATKWAKKRNITFRVITENELFGKT